SVVEALVEDPAVVQGRDRAPGGALRSGHRHGRRGEDAEARTGIDGASRCMVAGRGTGRRAGALGRQGAAAALGPAPDLVARGAVPGDGGDRSATARAGAASRDRVDLPHLLVERGDAGLEGASPGSTWQRWSAEYVLDRPRPGRWPAPGPPRGTH